MEDLLFEASVFVVGGSLEQDSVSGEDSNAESLEVLGVGGHREIFLRN